MAKFLDDTGLTYLWGKIKTALANKMDKSNPYGTGSFSMNRAANSTIGDYSTAEGYLNTASGMNSHAEGLSTLASGMDSHAEGYYTRATAGEAHAEGFHTRASSAAQHVSGKYNIEDTQDQFAEIIGNGTSSDARSNARTLDWSGNETIAGDLFFNGDNTGLSSQLSAKQNTLTPGSNIQISGNTISATDTKPTGYDTADVASKALASSVNWSNVSSINITAGTWLINYGVNFPSQGSGNTGHRGAGISVESGTSAPAINMRLCTPCITQDNYTTLASSGVRVATGNETVYLNARQTSGSSMNVAGRLRVIKIL